MICTSKKIRVPPDGKWSPPSVSFVTLKNTYHYGLNSHVIVLGLYLLFNRNIAALLEGRNRYDDSVLPSWRVTYNNAVKICILFG